MDEEAGQTLLDSFTVAGEVQDAPAYPDKSEYCGGGVVEVNRAKPQRHQKSRHPFERIRMHTKDAFEVGIARRCWKLHVKFAPRYRNARRKEKIERYGEQCHDRSVMRHDDILCWMGLSRHQLRLITLAFEIGRTGTAVWCRRVLGDNAAGFQ